MTPDAGDTPNTGQRPALAQIDALLAAAGRPGHYRIVSEVGWGGFGIVYKAIDTRLNRAVAIKAIHSSRLVDARVTSRLRTEALAAASLDHPYICKIYELIESGDDKLIVMEFVEGETLRSVLRRGVPPLEQTIQLAIEIAEGLANAHERGLVHRDLKPANVMLTPHGHIKLLDFGMALEDATSTPADETEIRATPTDAYAGTPHYMAPEQAAGRLVTSRADLFSFGVLLFECVTGQLPFKGSNPYDYVSHLMSDSPTPVHYVAPHVPAELARLIDHCLDKMPSKRPESATAVGSTLQKLADALSASGYVVRTVRAARAQARRKGLVAAGLVVLASLAAWQWYPRTGLRDAAWHSRPVVTSSGEKGGSRISPDGQWLSFLATVGGASQIFVQRLAGGGAPQRVTIPAGAVLSHVWADRGDELAYALRQGTTVTVQVVPAFFGGEPVSSIPVVPTPVRVQLLRWIGRQVYLAAEDRRGSSLLRVDLDRGAVENLTQSWKIEGAPTGFDVDLEGRRVAFASRAGDREDLWVANLDGTSPVRLTDDAFFERHPLWFGSGSTIVYQSNRGGQTDLWEISTETRRSRQLTSSQTVEEPESTSADGTLLSFVQVSENANLWRWDPATGGGRQLTSDSLNDFSPTSAAGGAAVVFQRARPSVATDDPIADARLFVMALGATSPPSEPRFVSDGFAARLSPDGARVAYLQRTADEARATLTVKDLATNTTIALSTTSPRPAYSTFPADQAQRNVTWNASGTELFFVDRPDGYTVRRYRVGAGAADPPLATPNAGEPIHDVILAPDGRVLVYVVGSARSSSVHQFDLTRDNTDHVVGEEFAGAVYPRGWLSDGSVVLARSVGVNEDFTADIEIVVVSSSGVLKRSAVIARGFIATTRLDPAHGILYVTRSEGGLHNLYGFVIATGALRRVTDNAVPGVTFSGVEPLAAGAILGVRSQRSSDIWLMDSRTSEAAAEAAR